MHRVALLLLWAAISAASAAQTNWRLTNYGEKPGTPNNISNIQQDQRGFLWVSTYTGLYRFDGYEWRNYTSHSGDGTRLRTNYIKHLYLSRDGNLWCLVDHHAILFDLKAYRFVDVLADYEQTTGQQLEISKIRTLTNGTSWFITEDGILLTIDSDRSAAVKLVLEGLSDDDTTLWADDDGTTWIVTPDDVYSYDGNVLKRQPANSPQVLQAPEAIEAIADPEAIESPELSLALGGYHFTDAQKNIWFFRDNHLAQLSSEKQLYEHFPLPQPGMIRCAMKDSKGRLWLSDRTNGCLMLFTPDCKLIGYVSDDGQLSPTLQPFCSPVYSIMQDRHGDVWAGTQSGGLVRLRENGEGAFTATAFTQQNSALNDNKIYALTEDSQHRLWIATDLGGLNCMEHPNGDNPDIVNGDSGLKGYRPEYCRRVYTLLATHDNHLLAGTAEGLYVADISTPQTDAIVFKEHQREAHRTQSLGSSNVGSMAETSDHRLFVGTQGGGVNEILSRNLMADQLDFRHYNVANGLSTDLPRTMFVSSGSLWVVDKDGLTELGRSDSLLNDCSIVSRSGMVFTNTIPLHLTDDQWLLGVEDGAVIVRLSDLKQHGSVPPIVVTGVDIEGADIGYVPQNADTIVLSPGQRNVSITFAALNYSSPQNISYAFRMGDNQQWNQIGSGGHSVTLANMEPGTYSLTLRSTNGNGQWMDNYHSVTVIVRPTFWQTGWAKLLIVLIILTVAAVVTYTLLYIRRIKRQQHETLEAYMALIEPPSILPGGDEQRVGGASFIPPSGGTRGAISDTDEAFMKRLMAYVEANISNSDASPEDMADATATSRSNLHRKVNRLVGMSPMKLLRTARMRLARQLLDENRLTINDIAYKCGFADPKYFSKCFKQATGKTPSQYRDGS